MINGFQHNYLRIILAILVWCSTVTAHAQFSIGPGGWVTIQEGGTLMIDSDLHIKSISGASGYLVDQTVDGDVTITGDIDVDRYMTADMWHNVSSPVSDETSGCYSATDLIFWYNEALILNDWNFGWVWYQGATGGPLVVFRGYDVYFYTNPVTVVYQATGAETINTGGYTIGVINTTSTPSEIPSHKGWNLLGNPYPSPVDWLAPSGWDKSDINDAKYIWDGSNNIYTIFIGGGSPVGINGGTRFIPSNQGFWVQSIVESGTVSINNATRVGDITGTPDFYKLAPIDYPLVSLLSYDDIYHDEIVVRFIEGTTAGFDINWDAMKLFSINPDVPQLSIRSGKQVMALNTLPEIYDDLCVPLNFQCAQNGNYNIKLTPRTYIEPGIELYLRDDFENIMINMREDSIYRFYHHTSNAKERFKLYFNPSEDVINNITPETYFSVYSNGNTITIIKNTIKVISGDVIIYDMLGRIVYHGGLGNDKKSTIQLNLDNGVYIVSLVTGEYTHNAKVYISQGDSG